MVQSNIISQWFGRNWPLTVTGTILAVGVGVLLMRSSEFSHPPAVEAAVVVAPSEAVIIPGRATVVLPGGESGAKAALVSETRVVD